ncbi:fructokinase ScrK [Schleiferilactobacillus harbinensis]|jgi:fructokinase|uniref:fructokinase ScrK n=1 Tax=Schleiferilactobacillus harbinensis TaxID=304207 RepID=UPI002430299C|nr:fructokinase ScrK [Schleiferilactobacillus harbinensis]MCI1784016.1 ROK family protein [Schleiferilactobacillus harbinensis]MCI1849547.1 ROK family protein [Schleiferilactobacillus harbinensis]
MQLGSIEAGGTKFVCAIGDENYRIHNQTVIPTTTPAETLAKVAAYFSQFSEMKALSIASFGPIEIRRNSEHYGYITDTPKPGWRDTDFVGTMKQHFAGPIYWTTDVNGSAYGEYVLSALFNENIESLVYYTIGTGVGAGVIVDGRFLGTLGHPEMGHVYVKRHPADRDFKGICPFHGDCLEGLVSGPTFEARTGKKGQDVPLTDPVFDIVAYYIAQAAIQTTLTVRPNKIIFGGGVMSESLLRKVRREFKRLLNNYVAVGDLDHYLTMPQAKNNGSATIGNFALALREYNR